MTETAERIAMAVRRRVDDRLYLRSSEPVEMTVAEAEAFIELYDQSRSHDAEDNMRPASPRPYVGMTGTVFGYPTVIVSEVTEEHPK